MKLNQLSYLLVALLIANRSCQAMRVPSSEAPQKLLILKTFQDALKARQYCQITCQVTSPRERQKNVMDGLTLDYKPNNHVDCSCFTLIFPNGLAVRLCPDKAKESHLFKQKMAKKMYAYTFTERDSPNSIWAIILLLLCIDSSKTHKHFVRELVQINKQETVLLGEALGINMYTMLGWVR